MLRVNHRYILKYLSPQYRRTTLLLLLMMLILAVLNPLICIIHCAIMHRITQPVQVEKASSTLFFCDLTIHKSTETRDPAVTYLSTFFVSMGQETSLHDSQTNIATIVFIDLLPIGNGLVNFLSLLMILLSMRFFYIPLLSSKPPTPPPRFVH